MRKPLVTLAAAAAVVGASTPTAAITNDWVDDDVHDYVGLVVFYDDDGEFSHRCSGSLIDDTTFLTAGHCTDGATSARIWFQQDAGANFDPETEHDPVSGYPDVCLHPTLCVESDNLYNFGFDDFVTFPDTHDVGVVILTEPPSGVEGRGDLPAAATLDPLAIGPTRNRTVFTVSGYGLTKSNPQHVTSFRVRLMASSRLTNLRSSLNDGFNLQSNGNGRGFGGTCSGDSGGPVFLGDTDSDEIVAVTSFGLNAWCKGTDFSYRLDRREVLDWIEGGYAETPQEPTP